MIEHYNCNGHEIAVELIEVVPTQYRWVWRIDGVHHAKSRDVLLSAEVARSEALLYAQIAIHRLKRLVLAGIN